MQHRPPSNAPLVCLVPFVQRRSTGLGPRPARAFTIVELMVVLGVVAVLVGLMLPALGNAREESLLTKRAVLLKHVAALVALYTESHKDVFPIAHENANLNMFFWTPALKDAGLFTEWREVDPEDRTKQDFYPGIALNQALFDDWRQMCPGYTIDERLNASDPVRVAEIHYPDRLGMMVKNHFPVHDHWCCIQSPVQPVIFVDHSLARGRWTDFIVGDELIIENQIGFPIACTWYGSRGRDR